MRKFTLQQIAPETEDNTLLRLLEQDSRFALVYPLDEPAGSPAGIPRKGRVGLATHVGGGSFGNEVGRGRTGVLLARASNQYVSVNGATNALGSPTSFSVALALRLTTLTTENRLLGYGQVLTDGFYLSALSDGRLRLTVGTGASSVAVDAPTGTLVAGEDYVIGMSYATGGNWRIVVNGVILIDSAVLGAVAYTGTRNLRIGASQNASTTTNGRISTVGIATSALTADELADITGSAVDGILRGQAQVDFDTLHVDPDRGNDVNDGSDATPWETMAYAVANAPNDSLVYMSGDFTAAGETSVTDVQNRTGWVTFMPHPTRAITGFRNVVLRRTHWTRWVNRNRHFNGANLQQTGASGANASCRATQVIGIYNMAAAGGCVFTRRVERFTLAASRIAGTTETNRGIFIQGNAGQQPGFMGSHNIFIMDTYVHDCFGDGIGMYETAANVTILRCRVDRSLIAPGSEDHADGAQLECILGLHIKDSLFHENQGSGGGLFIYNWNMLNSAGIRIENTAVTDTATNGVQIRDQSSGAGGRGPKFVLIENSIFVGSGLFYDLSLMHSSSMRVYNSVIGEANIAVTNQRDHNLIGSMASGSLVGSEVSGTPTYVDAASGDYRVAVGSALGTTLAQATHGEPHPDRDIDSAERVYPAAVGAAVAA